jgi:hypothetical protein
VRTAVAAPVSAQAPAADKWTVTVAPYLMGAAMKGTTADLFWGGRVNYLSTNLRINSPLQVRSVDGSKRASLEFGYRWLDIDYSTGEATTLFKYDVLTQGPIMGFAFRF